MDLFWLRRARAYYHEDIEKVMNFEIWEKPTVRGAKLSQRCIQNAYKDMKELKFRGNIIDFLCYICLLDSLQYITRFIDYHTKDEIIKFLSMYNFVNQVNLRVSCKLVLKDETFIEDAFKYFETTYGVISIEGEKEKKIMLAVRDYYVKYVNIFMRYDPKVFDSAAAKKELESFFNLQLKRSNKSSKLKRS